MMAGLVECFRLEISRRSCAKPAGTLDAPRPTPAGRLPRWTHGL